MKRKTATRVGITAIVMLVMMFVITSVLVPAEEPAYYEPELSYAAYAPYEVPQYYEDWWTDDCDYEEVVAIPFGPNLSWHAILFRFDGSIGYFAHCVPGEYISIKSFMADLYFEAGCPLWQDILNTPINQIAFPCYHEGVPNGVCSQPIVRTPEREGYTFLGWFNHLTNTIFSSEELGNTNAGVFLGSSNHIIATTFTAQWEETQTPKLNHPCATTNLARDILGSTMSASSFVHSRPYHRANNGIQSGAATQSWSATDIGHEWLQVDFGQVRNFNHIRIYQGGNRIADYRFEYSNDGVNWTTFHSGLRMMPATPAFYEYFHPTTIQARYVRLVSERSNGVLPIVVFEFEVYYNPGNLAHYTQGATMSASSYMQARPYWRANNGIREGVATQSWSATDIGQEWLRVDFGQIQEFNHIRIFQGGNRITDYRFEYSNDGVNWTTFHSGLRMMQATPAHYAYTHHATIHAQYVRLVSDRSSGVLPIVVFEFEVYHMPGM